MPGVERMMFDRIGDAVTRATSLVRYAPNSRFSPHVHGGGEEFFVMQGEFADEHRACSAGTYVHNLIRTSHTPRIGAEGCVIFVKLHQFDAADGTEVVIDTHGAEWTCKNATGIETLPVHRCDSERLSLLRVAPHTSWRQDDLLGGEEILVIAGSLEAGDGACPAGSKIPP